MLSSVLSLVVGYLTRKIQHAVIGVLAAGPIPRHVAFIMDGNRRFARIRHQRSSQGHIAGYHSLKRNLEICLRLGISCVSVYAFALENFKRPPDEVEALMNLFEEKVEEFCRHGDLLDRYHIRFNVVGKKELLPERVQRVIQKAEGLTKENSGPILNFCMPYDSREEISTAVRRTVEKAIEEDRDISKINEHDITSNLRLTHAGSPPLDILVRTSGVHRLSDFMTWQACEDVQLHFVGCYWPDFGLREFLPIILDFQRKVWAREQHDDSSFWSWRSWSSLRSPHAAPRPPRLPDSIEALNRTRSLKIHADPSSIDAYTPPPLKHKFL